VQDEARKVVSRLKDDLGINLRVVDASDRFLERLDGACNTVAVPPHRPLNCRRCRKVAQPSLLAVVLFA
jgi:hypothetical protein